MSESLNSPSGSKARPPWMELPADLTLNHDEVLDLQLGLSALGGLRHSAACDATERSNRRFDERNHRMHETRMKSLGMEGDEQKPEADDMSQQVLIRSPIQHHYHYASPPPQQQQPPQVSSPVQPPPNQPASGLSGLAKAAIVVSGLLGTAGVGASIYALLNRGSGDTTINQTGDAFGVGLVPPGPPSK